MARELTKKEIYERMVELRNLRKLHTAARQRIELQEDTIRLLKKQVALLQEQNQTYEVVIEDHKLQLEELRTIVFGRKKEERHNDTNDDVPTPQVKEKKQRSKESYKRPVPKDDDVTENIHHSLNTCPHCSNTVLCKDVRTYYEEDIPLQQRIVRKHTVERGHCGTCNRTVPAAPLPCATVILGETVKRYITYLSVVCRLSYSQIMDLLTETYHLAVSEGEIAKILERTAATLRPQYERLLESIRGEPSVHLDETGWRLFLGDGMRRYAWGMVGGMSSDTAFVIGKTRGKGNAAALLGGSTAVVVSDDYGAYRSLKNPHQLCCAHILRKVRDLARSEMLTSGVHDHCADAYHTFAGIYADIDAARMTADPMAQYDILLARLQQFIIPRPLDPKKLARVKKQVRARSERYLTCLTHPSVIPDNNPAERALRHLVLKRKVSFGSLTEVTAERLAVLTSVLMTFKHRGALRSYLQGGV